MRFLHYLAKQRNVSERKLAHACGLARETIRTAYFKISGTKIETLQKIAEQLDHDIDVLVVPQKNISSDESLYSASINIIKDGFDSWKIHLFNFVDHFRKTKDIRLLYLPPSQKLDRRLQALFNSVAITLCESTQLEPPKWTKEEIFLETPWFVSGIESLKASGLLESPHAFKKNNVYVLENFLQRA